MENSIYQEKTCKVIREKLEKAKRKYDVCDNRRHAVLYCIECGKRLGEFDMFYESHEAHKYCGNCAKKFILPTPIILSESMSILTDFGTSVLLRYENIRQEEIKQCYFSKKGRFIKIKSKRVYF